MKRTRIILIIGLLTVLSIFGVLGYWVVGRAKDQAAGFAQVSLTRLALVGSINANQAEGYSRVLLLLNADETDDRARLRTAIDEYRLKNDKALRDYRAMWSGGKPPVWLEQLIEKRAHYSELRDQVLALSDQNKKAEALALAKASLWPAYQEYTLAGDWALREDVELARKHAAHILRVCEISQLLAALVAVFGFIGGITLPLTIAWIGRGSADDAPLHP
jgi:hypothetical protein